MRTTKTRTGPPAREVAVESTLARIRENSHGDISFCDVQFHTRESGEILPFALNIVWRAETVSLRMQDGTQAWFEATWIRREHAAATIRDSIGIFADHYPEDSTMRRHLLRIADRINDEIIASAQWTLPPAR